ncbi:hypothetical protein D3C76_1876740 [compost metagenome]
MQLRPVLQLLFIVNEDAAVLDGGPVRFAEIGGNAVGVLGFDWNVRPIIPGGNPHILT